MAQVNIAIVGDGACGKSAMARKFARNEVPVIARYAPTSLHVDYHTTIELDEAPTVHLRLSDTAGQGMYGTRIRPLAYQGADAALICFAINNPTSFMNVTDGQGWRAELNYYVADVPFVLVGCKADTRDDGTPVDTLVSLEEARTCAAAIGAKAYLECSSIIQNGGVHEVFEVATRATLQHRAEQQSTCCQLCVLL